MSLTLTCPRRLKTTVSPNLLLKQVHRIGRTGRNGKTGLATTFINRHCTPEIQLDLLHLLKEAKQKIPPVLKALDYGEQGVECTFCGGLGHRITECARLEGQQRKEMGKSMREGDGCGW